MKLIFPSRPWPCLLPSHFLLEEQEFLELTKVDSHLFVALLTEIAPITTSPPAHILAFVILSEILDLTQHVNSRRIWVFLGGHL
ncbi:uncharacterized protein ATNIH1004_007382 [Aspergillus tanneri]|uniref:Uncharacterized protein n=1 Tax=Aspergillus tanneri TaxID=1220188 RepID=A0A5M9MG70_9EURO|nr:uncharacterized protein ATNIH1004_007382 [Aspergillus tanneri]KAA8645961.1 hypothetical protein ATNIH1004_007382 [Aspergillus tanneri]